MSELKAFDVGLGQYCEDGSPCVVAFDADQNPRLLNEKVYLKYEADKVIAHHKYKRCLAMADACRGNFLVAEHMIEKEPKNLMWHKRHKLYGRWMMLWRCFAEEFKEVK